MQLAFVWKCTVLCSDKCREGVERQLAVACVGGKKKLCVTQLGANCHFIVATFYPAGSFVCLT